MDLRKIVSKLYNAAISTPLTGFISIAEAELFLQQAYEGRYLFELIQNVRDANRQINKEGEIFITLKNDLLMVANTGAEFNDSGIVSITTIGQSNKQSQDFIGFKGIGFKSVQEISDRPRIITKYGSIIFNRSLTAKDFKKVDREDLPLFYCPHYSSESLSSFEIDRGIATKIELPLKAGINEQMIIKAFEKIQVKELVLLGSIVRLEFHSSVKNTTYLIDKKEHSPNLTVFKDELPFKFRTYSPLEKITIPGRALESLGKKEKRLFAKNPQVELKIVMELNEQGHIKLMENTKLYLFYPLEILSGFRFIIHSYFIVDPERKSLRNSDFNKFLLGAIGQYIGNDLLKSLKETKNNAARILTFVRQNDEKLDTLFDSVVENLKDKKFIFDSKNRKYYGPQDVIAADGFDQNLFPDNTLGNKHLIYLDDKVTLEWLKKEFKVQYLHYDRIAEEIENECKRQAKLKNTTFFQHLYNYVADHEGLKITGKKVLLTDQWTLVSSDDDVFYGGGRKYTVSLSLPIKKHIHFIHKEIRITDLREGKSRTGITEFSTFELARRLLKLMHSNTSLSLDILNALYGLELDAKSILEIREKILLPDKNKTKWVSPIFNPVYLDIPQLNELYPNGNFIETNVLTSGDSDENSKIAFLKICGAWDIPAAYVTSNSISVSGSDHREELLTKISDLSTRPFIISNDRVLDIPRVFNYWFTSALFDNWERYSAFISSDFLPRMQYGNSYSSFRTLLGDHQMSFSGFLETLRKSAWVYFKGDDQPYRPTEIIGIDPTDFFQSHNQVVKRYVHALPVAFQLKKELIKNIGMLHLDADNLQNFIGLFDYVYNSYKDKVTERKEFTDFYNRLLNKLFEYYSFRSSERINLQGFKGHYFLAFDEVKKLNVWERTEDIFYIDDKPNYDILTPAIKERVQPHFTLANKNTFGKIAALIGKRFSNSITRQLKKDTTAKNYLLSDFFKELPEIIAILENLIERDLNKELEIVKKTMVYERNQVIVIVIVGQAEPVEIETDYFVDPENGYDLHITNTYIKGRNKVMAEAMQGLFVELLDRDLKKFGADLFRFLNTKDKNEYLADYDIPESRVIEIREKLFASTLSIEQRFWDAVLSAKAITDRHSVFNGLLIDENSLAKQLNTSEFEIQSFSRKFNFHNTARPENVTVIKSLLIKIDLSLSQLNFYLYPKIDFRESFDLELKQLKNRFELGFALKLHHHLKGKAKTDQQTYLSQLDEYQLQFQPVSPKDIIIDDVENYFLLELNHHFNFSHFSARDIKASYIKFNLTPVYLTQVALLKRGLSDQSIIFREEQLADFLSKYKWGSLLYFDQVPFLMSNFKSWLKTRPKEDTMTNQSSDSILAELDIQVGEIIENVATKSVVPPPERPGTPHRGPGSRVDGSLNDAYKQKIGLAAEMVVFQLLDNKYSVVNWISKNASRAPKDHKGYNPQGDDKYGYDIDYLDSDGNKHYVEVKGRGEQNDSFEITKYEVSKAKEAREFYQVILVTNTLDSAKRKIRNLGNLFMLQPGQDFFSNDKFTAVYKTFEIRFHQV